MPDFYEFFAGGGMVRCGLGPKWRCLFANDFDHKKSSVYQKNWGEGSIKTADVRFLTTSDLPSQADLAWASFPCQDLSLAGGGAGLKGDRSGTFWPFWDLIKGQVAEGKAPAMVVLENVCGTLTSHSGKDFAAICGAFQQAGYRFGAVVIDASLFIPHSRQRLFVIGVRHGVPIPESLIGDGLTSHWHSQSLKTAFNKLPDEIKKDWVSWSFPMPPVRNTRFVDLIEDNPESVSWHSPRETKKLLSMMSKVNLAKVDDARKAGRKMIGAIYKRTRHDENGQKVQRAEVRFDEVAGCLRTPAGGSSRQLIIVVDGDTVKSRLISSRETARLMGLPDNYQLPDKYNEAYHLTGDGVVVPVVQHLAEHVFEPILSQVKQLSWAVA